MHALRWILASFLVLVPVTALQAQEQGPRIGYIDSGAILQQAPGAQEAQAEFDRQMERFTREIETMEEELEALIEEYERQQSALLPAVRQAREDEIRQREIRYHQRIEEMGQEADATRQRLIEPILNQMSQAIETIRAEGDYAIIFDVAGQSIIAADPSLDLTDQVITRLRQAEGSD